MPWRPHLNMGSKVVILVARQALRRTPVGTVTHVGIKVGLQGSDLLAALHTHWTSVREGWMQERCFCLPCVLWAPYPDSVTPALCLCEMCLLQVPSGPIRSRAK